MNSPIIALVGLCGAGKSGVAAIFQEAGYVYLRFGQITLDELTKQGLSVNEDNERRIRESIRAEHGMAAFAKLNMTKIDELLAAGKLVLIDGLYSWSEYKLLKEKYEDSLVIIAVYAPPSVRYARLAQRQERHADDHKKQFRSIAPADAKRRDYAEIENSEKAGPITMADFTIVNTGTPEDLQRSVVAIMQEIKERA